MKKSEHTPHRTALSVNVNKVALVRNTRLGIPSVTRAAELCLQAGARASQCTRGPTSAIRSQDVFRAGR
jgi:pyridoxine 5-phosphate synthase